MSARVRASATASLPEIRSSLSSAAAGAGLVATAMSSPPYTVLCCAFSPGIPAVISTPPWSRSATSSCSYWPRKRKPCERTVAFLSPIFSAIQLRYLSLSFRHISHWLALSSKTDSLTIVMQCSTGQTASQTPQPQQASMFASYVPSGITSKQESGHWIQQSVHFTQVSKLTTGRMVRVVYFLKYGLRSGTYPFPSSFGLPTGIAGIVTPSRISHHFGISKEYGISELPSVIFTSRVSSRSYALRAEATLRSEPHSIDR